ncbi:hypothetical protein RGUI_0506 [Rhodovulum sp. P5]|uniref:hypothetical protein n=1 Tax=Rhodovulum sp. P5 TaxID=1564506 RepID=UPI0009C2645B|nr:hypothetical protein [Rhodovulum sp. P5]ARE38647.1 hypothetical protein RGUI_0506 [Rhodovulum sp. P5]
MQGRILTIIVMLLTAQPAAAEERDALLDFQGDSFRAGGTVVFDKTGTDDLFMAGETVRAETDIAGSAHMAGRKVRLSGAVGGDAYLAGMDIELSGPVAGDATLAGYDITVGEVGGDLRISGGKLRIEGPVGGYAMIAGEEVHIAGVIAGDVSLTASEVDFSEDARIDGQITVYEETPGKLEIPETVAPKAQIERQDLSKWEDRPHHVREWTWYGAAGGFLMGVIVVAAIAALIAAVIPQTLAEMRRGVLARPFRSLGIGFVAQSALVGSAVLFAMTIIGLVLTPAAVFLAFLAGFAGYVVGVYAFGVGLHLAFGRPEPASIGQRALAAGTGALAAGLISLIPLLGWLFVLALVLAGVGAIAQRTLDPVSHAA